METDAHGKSGQIASPADNRQSDDQVRNDLSAIEGIFIGAAASLLLIAVIVSVVLWIGQ